jgi:serine/threonine protein kinase
MAAEPRRSGDNALPKRVGRYEAFLQIGAGGMARVYLAVQRGTPGQTQLVVVKLLRPEAIEDEHVLSLFMDEARIAMRLQHPNVIRTREVIAEAPDYLLAMDFQNGQSLLHVLRRLGRQAVPLEEHIYILCKVLAGLSYAHELKDENGQPFGIVHRDVSPANVIVSYSGEIKLIDFGIAKATGALAATQDGVVKGKLGYAAPEQCLGKPADPRSDIYAVGVMLWEAIAGRRRASGETWHSVLQARLDDAEPQLEEVCPEAPKALTEIARKALAREPEGRYATAREFQKDLEKYLAASSGRLGAARIAAMLKPHFDQDRADQHKSVEAYLNTLRSSGSGQRPRVPLPAGAAAPAPRAVNRPAPPVVEEEQTSRIPVDAALLIMSRREAAAASERKSASTSPPPSLTSVPTSPPPSQASVPTSPPPSLASVKTSPPPSLASVPTSPPPSLASVKTSPPPERTSSSSQRASAPSLSFAPAALTSLPPPSFPPSSARGDAYGLVTTVSKPVLPRHVLPSASDGAPFKKKARVWPVVLAVAGVAGVAVLGVLPLHRGVSAKAASTPEPTTHVEAKGPASTVSSAPRVDMVKVRISVDPADAVVKLDGRILQRNPFVATLPKDNALHELTAYAEGCRDMRQVVHLNQDVDLLVALKHQKGFVHVTTAPRSAAAAAAAAPAPVPAPPQQPVAAEAHPAPPAAEPGMNLQGIPSEAPPKRAADEENPYSQ